MEEILSEAFGRGIRGAWSHPDPIEVIDDVDFETAGRCVEGFPFSIWQVSRHMIEWGWVLVNKLKGQPVQPHDPENNYFPVESAPPDADAWRAHRQALHELADQTAKLLKDVDSQARHPEFDNISTADLLMVLITHNSYHTAQIVMLRRMLGVWGKK